MVFWSITKSPGIFPLLLITTADDMLQTLCPADWYCRTWFCQCLQNKIMGFQCTHFGLTIASHSTSNTRRMLARTDSSVVLPQKSFTMWYTLNGQKTEQVCENTATRAKYRRKGNNCTCKISSISGWAPRVLTQDLHFSHVGLDAEPATIEIKETREKVTPWTKI